MDNLEPANDLDLDVEENSTPVKLVDWKNAPKFEDLKQDIESAAQDHKHQVAKVDAWLENLHVTGSARAPKREGRSNVHPKVIRKQAEWRYPALSEPFLNSPELFKARPAGEKDKEGSYQHQLLLNHQLRTKMNKVRFIDDFVHTAVDQGTAIIRLGWINRTEKRKRKVPLYEIRQVSSQAEAEAFAMAQQQPSLPEEWQQAMQRTAQMQQLSPDQPVQFVPVKVGEKEVEEEITTADHPYAEVCDYKSVIPDPSCKGNLDNARFVGYLFETSIAELTKEGRYKNLDHINVEAASPLADPDMPDDKDRSTFQFKDKLRKRITATEYWGYWDIHGTGELHPIVATWVGSTLIRLEESPFPDKKLPFLFIPLLHVSQSLYGEPDGELLEENQKIVGAVMRGMIDLMARSANGQRGMHMSMLDVTNRRKFERGEDYLYGGTIDPRMGLIEHKFPEIPASAQYMLQMIQMDNESLTGTKTFDNGMNSGSLGDVAAGIRGVLNAASKREMSILRRLAQGIQELGQRFAGMNAEFLEKEEIVRITDREFVAIKPEALAVTYDIIVDISTAEEDNAKAQELAFMLQTLGPQTDFGLVKIILRDIARLRRMPDLAKQIEDYEPKPNPLAEAKAKLEVDLLAAQVNKENQIANHYASGRIPLDQAKTQESLAKAANIESETDLNTLEFVEQENGVHHARDMEKIEGQAKAQAKMKIVEQAAKAQNESAKDKPGT